MNIRTFVFLPVVVLAMTACSSLKTEIKAEAAASDAQIAARREALRESILKSEQQRLASQEVNKPYIAGNSIPLSREVSMPEILRRPTTPMTALFSKAPVDLQTAVQQLSQATGITIVATPDALLPPSMFAQKTGGAQAQNPVQAPSRVVISAQNQPIWSVLDDVARQASVNWRPISGGAEFYRVETRVFNINAIPQVASTSASLGRNGGGANAVFDSQSKSSFVTKDQDIIKGLSAAVDALLSQSGKATVSSESQTIVVTDSKESLDRVEAFIKEQNKAMGRRVRVLIEAIEVVDKDNSEMGVDWSILYKTANEQISLAPLASLTGTQALSAGYTRTDSNGNSGTAFIKALNEVGTVVNRRSFPFLTTSGRPVTQALRNTFNYVDQVQTSTVASSTASATAPAVTQKDETVGTFVTLMPTAKPDGSIFLSISFDVTSAAPLVPFTIGSGSTAVTVQQKSIDGSGVIQEVPVRSGQTVVIGGIEQNILQSTQRRLGADAPMLLGGSDAHKVTKSRMILLVTAVTEEGI